jgi:hypothetical protein
MGGKDRQNLLLVKDGSVEVSHEELSLAFRGNT